MRRARPEELSEVGRVTVAAYDHDGYLVPDDPYVPSLRDAARRDREGEVYVATVPDLPALAGTVTFCTRGSALSELSRDGEGEFRMLAVAPAARRRGVAGSLVQACIDRSSELGHHAVVLSSLPQQEPAHRLYTRLGFRRTPELDWSPLPGVHLWGFRLDL